MPEDGRGDPGPKGKIRITAYRLPSPAQLAEMEEAIRDNPTDPVTWEWLGYSRFAVQKHPEALEAYRKALELDPARASAHYGIGNVLYTLGRHDEALESWRRVLTLAPASEEARRARRKLGEPPAGTSGGSAPGAISAPEVLDLQRELQREKMQALAVMSRGICHELNNPLMVVVGYTELIMDRLRSGEAVDELSLKKIHRAGLACADIIRRFANFASHSSEGFFDSVDLAHLVDEIIGILRGPYRCQGIRIVAKLEEGLKVRRADPRALQFCLLAILSNAQEAMPDGGLLEIVLSRGEDQALLTVRDTGIGMGKEEVEQLFLPFYTRKRNWKGVGLGMAEVYAVIERHCGLVSCESAPGKGTTIAVSLPLTPPGTSGRVCLQETTENLSPGGPPGAAIHRVRTLLLDEDEELGLLLHHHLSRMGHSVTVATDVRGSVDGFARGSFDLVVMDPQVSGGLLTRRVTQIREADPSVKLLLLLGEAASLPPPAPGSAPIRTLIKPFDVSSLEAVVRGLFPGTP